MASVTVHQRTCGKIHRITVSMKEDGNYSVAISSDCPKVAEYGQRIGVITLDDLLTVSGSRAFNPDVKGDTSSTCLSGMGVLYAGWIEAGMLAGSLVKKVGSNSIAFSEEDDV